jgi:hypothetical protein
MGWCYAFLRVACECNPLPLSLKVPALGLPHFSGSFSKGVLRRSWPLGSHACDGCHDLHETSTLLLIQALGVRADIQCMMISREQAHAAAVHLAAHETGTAAVASVAVSPEVLAAAIALAQRTPDTSPERIAEGESYLAGDGADSRAVAAMMLQRIVSDALR